MCLVYQFSFSAFPNTWNINLDHPSCVIYHGVDTIVRFNGDRTDAAARQRVGYLRTMTRSTLWIEFL